MKNYRKWIAVTAAALVMAGLGAQYSWGGISDAGGFAFGYFAAGDFAMGVFAAGTFSIGIFSAGIFSVGIFSISLFNLAVYGAGFFVWAYRARRLGVATRSGAAG